MSAFELVPAAPAFILDGGGGGVHELAVMSRATLGHTGQQLNASGATQAIYAAIIVACPGRAFAR